MKPGDLVRFNEIRFPSYYNYSEYHGKLCLVINSLVSPGGQESVVVLVNGEFRQFRSRLLEAIE
jgi:hypothetical protein